MVSAPEDDFATFLDLGDFQLNFPSYDPTVQAGEDSQQDAANAMDTSLDAMGGSMGMNDAHAQQRQPSHHSAQQSLPSNMPALQEAEGPFMDIHLQAQIIRQQQQQQQQMSEPNYRRQPIVPPTPNSIEMHGGVARYYQHMDPQSQAILQRYQRTKEDQMIFTPLVSPAVTPLDTQFQLPEYTVPGAYFSPLTSPALHAQNDPAHRALYNNTRTSDNSVPPSPIDMNVDLGANIPAPLPSPARKARRKMSAPRNPTRAVRQSPAMKPQRRKAPSSTVITPKELKEIAAETQMAKVNLGTPRQNPAVLSIPPSQDSSEAESISPEPLSEALMAPPPPPKTGSAGRSPYIVANHAGSRSAPMIAMTSQPKGMSPATPASLMKLQKQSDRKGNEDHPEHASNGESTLSSDEMEQIMDGVSLPEATPSSRPSLPRLDTQHSTDDQITPTLSARRTPKFGAPRLEQINVPVSTAPNSAVTSPQFSELGSPDGAIPSKRGELKSTARGAKKRNNATSVQVSPALRPKISPSIKPLLPEGAVSAETSALLLASKSNYQNILEGTHLPGVSYPKALSTNLTLKRTSHKIAEQGRRNRINNALQEIASLLPSTAGSNGNSSSGSGGDAAAGITSGSAAQQSNSKASTVEMAIDYIKALQKELAETKGRLEVVEKQIVEK
ncbi:MAG: hypothetical protein M1827_000963 [Pycnora praestabilis]|nr:MAG: hypothetical protein M1827_000963 [Pycnora praestabilis]